MSVEDDTGKCPCCGEDEMDGGECAYCGYGKQCPDCGEFRLDIPHECARRNGGEG